MASKSAGGTGVARGTSWAVPPGWSVPPGSVQAAGPSVRDGAADNRDEDPRRRGREQGRDHAATEREQKDGGAGEDGVLPPLLEPAGERERGAEDRADCRRAGAVEEGACPFVGAEPVELGSAEEHERERGREGDRRGQQAASDAR